MWTNKDELSSEVRELLERHTNAERLRTLARDEARKRGQDRRSTVSRDFGRWERVS